jgi:predicted nucleic acid-binding protein
MRRSNLNVRLLDADDNSLLLPDVALAETAFVLLRVYRWPVTSVADAIRAVVNHRAIDVPGREIWLDVADDLERGSGPVDAYLLRTAERPGIGEILTFDEEMRSLPNVRRVAP